MDRVAVIGSGLSGMSAACFLAQAGFQVEVFEKNQTAGGRARVFEKDGFSFDMGPSWYWMPDVFENFFGCFGKQPGDYYALVRLDPSYQVFFSPEEKLLVPAGLHAVSKLFESIEPGSGAALAIFLQEAAVKYKIAMTDLVFNPGLSLSEFLSADVFKNLISLHVFQSISSHLRKYFRSPKLIQLLEFPVLFLGAKPERTPSLYSLMNHADIALGTWYPMGGMHEIVDAMHNLATSLGVRFHFNSAVESIQTNHNAVTGIVTKGEFKPFDYLVASADYHHVEQELLPPQFKRYSAEYWKRQVMAPSALIYYLGVRRKVEGLSHHNLFFDTDFGLHAREIYDTQQWPTSPQFYVSCPSKTDSSVAPPNAENIFVLIPTATGLTDSKEIRDRYLAMALDRIKKNLGQDLSRDIIFQRSYAHSDFCNDYNAYKGNAYGLANILRQTANLKPSIINKKLRNLFYSGQLTVPGPGVPPAIISGQITASQLIKTHRELVNS